MLLNDEDARYAPAVFIAVLFVCAQQLSLPSIFHFLSAENIIPDWFCQPNIKRSDCLCDLKVFSHEYLKKLWLFVSVCVTAAVLSPGQERGDQTEVRRQDVPHICTSEGGEGMNCWMWWGKKQKQHTGDFFSF